jgi:hypothetical protein
MEKVGAFDLLEKYSCCYGDCLSTSWPIVSCSLIRFVVFESVLLYLNLFGERMLAICLVSICSQYEFVWWVTTHSLNPVREYSQSESGGEGILTV